MKIFGKEFKFNGFDVWHKGNQGSNSGLDADKLDGKHASEFANSSHNHNKSQITDFPSTLPANGGTSDGVNFQDTRSIPEKPSELNSRKMTLSFKNKTAVDNPPVGANSVYVWVFNVVGWNSSEGSGGWPIQLAIGSEGMAYRQAINTDTWGTWEKLSNVSNIPTKLSELINDVGFTQNALKQTVSSSQPSSPQKGDVWIQI